MFGLHPLPPIASPADPISPLDVLAGWPDRWPLTALWSSPASSPLPWARWTLLGLAEPAPPPCPCPSPSPLRWTPQHAHPLAHPQSPGVWVGSISFDAALAATSTWTPRRTTPTVPPQPPSTPAHNTLRPHWQRVTRAFIFDSHTSHWFSLGDLTSADLTAIADQGAALRMARDAPIAPLGTLTSNTGRDRFTDIVRAAQAAIAAGDAYQVNLAHLLRAPLDCHPRDAFRALAHSAAPWMGAYLEPNPHPTDHPALHAPAPTPHHTLISLSPELFLRLTPDRRLITRPIKGTRRASPSARADLLASDKERAELTMIVDLMRNDLARVCLPGSVAVTDPRTLELHGTPPPAVPTPQPTPSNPAAGVWHATATIAGALRPDASPESILDATLPPGSISGAPKASALALIHRLEAEPRGPYCGVIGWIGDDGSMDLAVAIRTASVHAGTLTYGVGAGIVHDSLPDLEWDETLAKAAVLAPLQHPPDTPAPQLRLRP